VGGQRRRHATASRTDHQYVDDVVERIGRAWCHSCHVAGTAVLTAKPAINSAAGL
jgi:hypothetical protein